ncbi:dna topoisomerase 6 subunit b [Quercus suber]|uniref:Dna topoisomerase 6 subunit b n=1 Tax=Quercus suber TaxID=58331 RepID=A0AAW0JL03_QUESU
MAGTAGMANEKPQLAILGAGIFVRNQYIPRLAEISHLFNLKAIWSRTEESARRAVENASKYFPGVLCKWGVKGLDEIIHDDSIPGVAVVLAGHTQGLNIFRFANRIPLLFEQGADVVTRTALKRIKYIPDATNAVYDVLKEMAQLHASKKKRYENEDAEILKKVSAKLITKETLRQKLAEHVEKVDYEMALEYATHGGVSEEPKEAIYIQSLETEPKFIDLRSPIFLKFGAELASD